MLECYPITTPRRTTEPTAEQEPVTLAEAKRQCGIAQDNGYPDPDLLRWIAAGRQQVENDTGLVCYTGTFTWKFTEWPYGRLFEIRALRPVTSITSITYIDGSGTTQTWSSSEYVFDPSPVVPIVSLAYASYWPSTRGDVNGITVTLVAGYADVKSIPQKVKEAVLLQVHASYLQQCGELRDAELQLAAYDRTIWPISRRTYP